MLTAHLKSRSKFLSLVLRHAPERIGLVLDPDGWTDVDHLLAQAAAHGTPLSRAELDEIVAGNDKRRFALSDDGRRIRAAQGHSVEVDLGYEPAEPPALLFHGTTTGTVPAIREHGLARMKRHAVHLSVDRAIAASVGGRHGEPIVLTVRAGEMHRDGHVFQISSNGVWLTDRVPPAYIDVPAATISRTRIARETLDAIDRGGYGAVSLRDMIERAVDGTVLHDLGSVARVIAPERAAPAAIEVTGESTIAALIRLAGASAPALGCLNFASARKPGGGFLGGAQAQEESLARSSALYPCLQTRMHDHYEPNRASRSLLYRDLAIYSPEVPFFRDDDGGWLDPPVLADVITCAAPNAGAMAKAASPELARVPETLRRRAGLVLRVAIAHQVETLVLGAWGAGVFGNDPALVADAFASLLEGELRHAFARVVFAVLDSKPGAPVRTAFEARFADHGIATR